MLTLDFEIESNIIIRLCRFQEKTATDFGCNRYYLSSIKLVSIKGNRYAQQHELMLSTLIDIQKLFSIVL